MFFKNKREASLSLLTIPAIVALLVIPELGWAYGLLITLISIIIVNIIVYLKYPNGGNGE